jgi:hypothetical protein
MSSEYYPLGRGGEMSEGAYQEMFYRGDDDEGARTGPEHLNADPGYWETKTHDIIAISAMTDSHVKNALRWMRARSFDGHPKYVELLAEQKRRQA